MVDFAKFDAYVEAQRERFVQEFAQFIRVPSVAAQRRGIHEMADLLTTRFERLGAQVTQYPAPEDGSPVVYAEIGSGERTLMIYNHYDVQPEDPLDLWDSDPFTLIRRDGLLIGRGTSDDKGELLSRIQALEAWLATQGALPLKIKWVVEGEEEIGSIHLESWVKDHAALLGADGILWEGGGYDSEGRYTMAAGCKGIAYFELEVHGPNRDMHSSMAPLVENPAWRLVWALSTIKNERDEITIDGYMDHVLPLSDEEIAVIDALPFEADDIKQRYGLKQFINGMDDTTAQRRLYAIPTATLCGLDSGYQGAGSKTVLPAVAKAKLDLRLVPNLTHEIAERLLRQHLDARGFSDIRITPMGGENPAKSPLNSAIQRAAFAACQEVFGQTPLLIPWFAGSGPMYPLSTLLGIPTISAGATWHPDARAHSPNENILEQDYFASLRYTASLLERFANGAGE